MNPPSPAGSNGSGRTPFGQFLPGNKYGKGNPLARKAQQLRVALSRAATVADVKAIARKMIDLAKNGDTTAAKLVLDRLLGPAVEWDLVERLQNLEAAVFGRKQ